MKSCLNISTTTVLKKGDIKKYSILFMEKYLITEEEITLDALVKSYHRYRSKSDVKDNVNFRAKKTMHNPPKSAQNIQSSLFK